MNEVLVSPREHRWPRAAFFKRLFWTAAGSCALGGLYSWRFGDHWLRIEHREMPLPGLGDALEGARLAHISDLHCSPIVLEKYLHQCVEVVNELTPDFVAITGDFITGPKHYARRVARVLRELHPRVATVACLGNHDYGLFHPRGFGGSRGLAFYLAEQVSHADVFVMLNESRAFRRDGAALQFVGVEDFWSGQFDPPLAFEHVRGHVPTVALCHNPDAAPQVADLGADWVLAGHTHGTTIRDTRLHDLVLPASNRHFSAGEYSLGSGRFLYVNRGLGYGRRINLNARPEITLFTLRKACSDGAGS